MNHMDHVNLLREGTAKPTDADISPVWADLGSGTGAFTLALADLLGPTGTIYSVDRDSDALRTQQRAMQSSFPQSTLHYLTANFTQPLDLPPLDGIVMANSLHFLSDSQKESVLPMLKRYLRPGGRLILVEYNADQGNTWVPYPLSYPTWERLVVRMGFYNTRLLASVPSRFLHEIYSAVSTT
jgi:ubiquinone/menaquinone biosynthesis C-methylase UbiE